MRVIAWRKWVFWTPRRTFLLAIAACTPSTFRSALPYQSSRRRKFSAAYVAVRSSKALRTTPPVFTFSNTWQTASFVTAFTGSVRVTIVVSPESRNPIDAGAVGICLAVSHYRWLGTHHSTRIDQKFESFDELCGGS